MDAAALTEPLKDSTKSLADAGLFCCGVTMDTGANFETTPKIERQRATKQRQGLRVPSLPSQHWLTSNNGGASNGDGGASSGGGGDASPSTCGGANPTLSAASPSAGDPSRDHGPTRGQGPSALLRA